MELKKSPKADLNNKRSYFFQAGVALALLMVIGLFSWSQPEKKIEQLKSDTQAAEMEQVEVTVQEDKRPPAPLKTQAVVISEMLNVVKNDTKIDNNLSMFDMDMSTDAIVSSGSYGGKGKKEELVEEPTPVYFAEEMPTFDGKDGKLAFSDWCQSNIKYPPMAAEHGAQGKVQISFIIEANGKLTNIKLVRGVNNKYLEEAAMEIVARGPAKWKPAKNNGRPVRLMYIMPIEFVLEQ